MKINLVCSDYSSVKSDGVKRITAYVDVSDIPNCIPMECNPRQQNMKSAVVKGIKESLLAQDGLFHIFNRGITLVAEDVQENDNILTINFEDIETQGCIDGGHTYKSILECQEQIKHGTQQVTVEILTGETVSANFTKLAMARNRSQQVKDQSLAELDKAFDWIKNTLKNEPYFNEVFYKENECGSINIEHIIWLMTVVNTKIFPDILSSPGIRPGVSMKGFIAADKKYGLTNDNPYFAAKDILIDLIKVYDYIEQHFADGYKSSYGKIKAVKIGKYKTLFYKNSIRFKNPTQFVNPVISALRAIVGVSEENGNLYWKVDPMEFIETALPNLSSIQIEIYRADRMLERCRAKETYRTLFREAICTYREMVAMAK